MPKDATQTADRLIARPAFPLLDFAQRVRVDRQITRPRVVQIQVAQDRVGVIKAIPIASDAGRQWNSVVLDRLSAVLPVHHATFIVDALVAESDAHLGAVWGRRQFVKDQLAHNSFSPPSETVTA